MLGKIENAAQSKKNSFDSSENFKNVVVSKMLMLTVMHCTNYVFKNRIPLQFLFILFFTTNKLGLS